MHKVLFFGGCVFALFLLCAEGRSVDQSDDSLAAIQEILRDADSLQKLKAFKATGCSCVKNDCGCCLDLNVPEIRLKDLTCANVTYLPDVYGIRVTLTINKFTLINTTVSAKNPPPICVAIPYLKDEASVCIDLYDFDVKNNTLMGCAKFELHLLHIIVLNQNIGCFHIPLLDRKSTKSAKFLVESMERSRQLLKLVN